MYWPDLHKLIDWLTRACDFVLFALTEYFPVVIVIIAIVVLVATSGGGLLPGCGGPISPLPTPTVTATPEPTPTLPLPPVSPLETPPW